MLDRHALILSRGDPGLFDVFKRIGRGVQGFVSGGLVGAARGLISSGAIPRLPRRLGVPTGPSLPPIGSVARPGGGRPIPILQLPGAESALRGALPRGFPGAPAAAGGGCAQGFHPNKSSYFTQAGFVPEGSKCVRNRRRNLSNGRANTRSLRRMAAWDKQERRLGKTLKAIARGR